MPSNTKRGGVCIYFKESLAVRLVDITSLVECLVCEVTVQNKKGYDAAMYRSPSQSIIEFESFLSGFEDMLSSMLFLEIPIYCCFSSLQFQIINMVVK